MQQRDFLKEANYGHIAIFLPAQIFLFCFFYGIFFLDYYGIDATIYFSTIDYIGAFIGVLIAPKIYMFIVCSISAFFIVRTFLNRIKTKDILFGCNVLLILLFILFYKLGDIYKDNYLIITTGLYFSLAGLSVLVMTWIAPHVSKELLLTIFFTGIVVSFSFILATQNYRDNDLTPDYTVSYEDIINKDLKLLANSSDFFIFYDKTLDRSFAVPTRSIKSLSTWENSLPRTKFYIEQHNLDIAEKNLREDIKKNTMDTDSFQIKLKKSKILLDELEQFYISKDPTERLAQLRKSSFKLQLAYVKAYTHSCKEIYNKSLMTSEKIQKRVTKYRAKIDELKVKAQKLNIKFYKKPLPNLTLPDFYDHHPQPITSS